MDNVTVKTGNKIRLWGGWYRHDRIFLDGIETGATIQIRRRNKRFDYLTCFDGAGVIGIDTAWAIREYKNHLTKLINFDKIVLSNHGG